MFVLLSPLEHVVLYINKCVHQYITFIMKDIINFSAIDLKLNLYILIDTFELLPPNVLTESLFDSQFVYTSICSFLLSIDNHSTMAVTIFIFVFPHVCNFFHSMSYKSS